MQEWVKTLGAVEVENIHFARKKDMILGARMLDLMFAAAAAAKSLQSCLTWCLHSLKVHMLKRHLQHGCIWKSGL